MGEIKANNGKSGSLTIKNGIVMPEDIDDQQFIEDYFLTFELDKEKILALTTDVQIRHALDYAYNGDGNGIENVKPHDQSAILLAQNMSVVLGDNTISITMYGYSISDKIFTHYASKTVKGNNTSYVFYNAKMAGSGVNDNGEEDLLNNRKAFELNVANEDALALEIYLDLKGTIDLTGTPTPYDPNQITIEIRRKQSNKYITTGTIEVLGTNIKGVTLELGKGTLEECQSSCSVEKRNRYQCKRIPADTYNFELNTTEESHQGQHVYRSLRLTDTQKNGSVRSGILIHRGISYSFTAGCILAMYSDQLQAILDNPENFINRDNMGYTVEGNFWTDYEASQIFNYTLYEYINDVDPDGTKTKTVYIIDEDADNSLTSDLSEYIIREKAGGYYYDLSVAIEAETEIGSLAKRIVDGFIDNQTGLLAEVSNEFQSINAEIESGVNLTQQQKRTRLVSVWEQYCLENVEVISANSINEGIDNIQLETDFTTNLQAWVRVQLQDLGEDDIDAIINRMFENRFTTPNAPVYTYYTKTVNGSSQLQIKTKANITTNFTTWLDNKRDERIGSILSGD